MKIAIVTFYNEAIADYGSLTSRINQIYCKKHGYTWIVNNTPSYKNRHPAWENLPTLLTHIDNYDYVVWIDADAFFYTDSHSMESILTLYPNDDFVCSRDLGNIPDGEINTGIFAVKNTEYAKKFLNKWAYDENLYNNNTMKYRWDQGVFNDMVRGNVMDIKNHMKLLDYGVLQHFYREDLDTYAYPADKPMIYHMAGRRASGKENERLLHSQEYLAQIESE